MNITDEMVERACIEAARHATGMNFPTDWEFTRPYTEANQRSADKMRGAMRAALEAAVSGDTPLENVLRDADVSSVGFVLNLGLDDDRQAVVSSIDAEVWTYGDNAEGTGPTIDTAIRAAVANVRGM